MSPSGTDVLIHGCPKNLCPWPENTWATQQVPSGSWGQGSVPLPGSPSPRCLGLRSLPQSPKLPPRLVPGSEHSRKHICPAAPATCSASSLAPFPYILISHVPQT